MARTHKDVEYAVNDMAGRERIFSTIDEAAGFALAMCLSHGNPWNLDVLCHSEAGAIFLDGDDGAEVYADDPDASVYRRIVIKADDVGRVP